MVGRNAAPRSQMVRSIVVFFSCFCVGAALRAHKGADFTDIEAVAQDADHVAQVYAAAAEQLTSQDEARSQLVAGNVEALGEAEQLLVAEKHGSADASVFCQGCTRDYAAQCPEGWKELSHGSCAALSGYDGPCAAFAYFSGMSAGEKADYARRCEACWPCLSGGAPAREQNGPVRVAAGQ